MSENPIHGSHTHGMNAPQNPEDPNRDHREGPALGEKNKQVYSYEL